MSELSGSAVKAPAKWNWIRRILLAAVVAIVCGCLLGIGVAVSIDIPEVGGISEHALGIVTSLQDQDGETYRQYFRENRLILQEGEVPDNLSNALLAAEDRKFYSHTGFDLLGVVRVAIGNLFRERRHGASTLTMQTAGIVFLDRTQRTWERKIAETLHAVDLEKQLSKEQILTLYCNLIPLGHRNYGFQAAARFYFDKTVDQLTVAEAATLVAIVPRPSSWSPIRRPEFMLERRNLVLSSMHDFGKLTDEELAEARAEPLGINRPASKKVVGNYFSEEVRKYLYRTYGETALYERGLQVKTSLDRRIQATAEKALRDGLERIDRTGGWRGALRTLSKEEMLDAKLRGWDSAPLPGEWAEGVVLDATPRGATILIGEARYQLDQDSIAWTRKRSASSLVSTGDVAWFRYREPSQEEKKTRLDAAELIQADLAEAAEARKADQPEDSTTGPQQSASEASQVSAFVDLVQEPEVEGALVVLENATGAIRGLVGGWDFDRNEFNRATQAKRQPGSAFKPIVFGAGFEAGYTPADTLFDAPVVFDRPGSDPYSPRNFYRDRYEGILTLRRALEKSINVSSVKLMDLVGVQSVIDFARRSGIRAPLPAVDSLALGTAEMTPLEVASAYAAFANQGVAVAPYLIESVATPDGRLLESHQLQATQAMSPEVAFLLVHTLRGVVQRGTANAARKIPAALAGKTGTTDDYTDAWFAGITPKYSITVWVGHDVKLSIGNDMTGAEAALPIWMEVINAGLAAGWVEADLDFPVPPSIAFRKVESTTGLLANSYSTSTINEAFIIGTEPVQEFDERWLAIHQLPWYQQRSFYGKPKDGERMPEDEADWETVRAHWEGLTLPGDEPEAN